MDGCETKKTSRMFDFNRHSNMQRLSAMHGSCTWHKVSRSGHSGWPLGSLTLRTKLATFATGANAKKGFEAVKKKTAVDEDLNGYIYLYPPGYGKFWTLQELPPLKHGRLKFYPGADIAFLLEFFTFTPDLPSASRSQLVLVVHGMATVINRRHECFSTAVWTEVTKHFSYWSLQVMIEVQSMSLPAMDIEQSMIYCMVSLSQAKWCNGCSRASSSWFLGTFQVVPSRLLLLQARGFGIDQLFQTFGIATKGRQKPNNFHYWKTGFEIQ